MCTSTTVGVVNVGNKFTALQEPGPAPSLATALPALPVPDPGKKIAVVLSSAYGAEITDTLPNFEILARSGAFNVYSVAPERTVLPLVTQAFRSIARADANLMFYAIDPATLEGPAWSVQDLLTPLLVSVLGAALVYGATHVRISRRQRLEPTPQPA